MTEGSMSGIDWDLVARYVAGTCAPAEREWMERMVGVHPGLATAVAATRDVAQDGDAELAEEELAVRLAAVKRSRGVAIERAAPLAYRLTPTVSRRSALRIAAAAAVLVGAVAVGRWALSSAGQGTTATQPAYSVITTAAGQRLSLKLSDGTLVTLAPASTLRTPADYGKHDRRVTLEGEAIFTVTHDATRPFAVHTPRAVATDLGTRFTVRAYLDDPATDIVVAEGKVAVRQVHQTNAASVDSVILAPGERGRITDSGAVAVTRGVALDDYLDWADGKLVFRGTPLRDAARRLARWYDIDIRLDPSVSGDRKIFAAVDNEAATDVLHTIAVSLDLRLSRAGRVFILTAN